MKQTKYTPGPWTTVAAKKPDISGIDYGILDTKGKIIAEVFHHVGFNDSGGYDSRPVVTNAHLIAAAPELLEALKELLAWTGPGTAQKNGARCETWSEAEDKSRAAISKAESRQ